MNTTRKGPGGGKGKRGSGRFTGRQLTTKVRTAKGRKLSSTRWLERQLNDPYVAEAKMRGYRSRAAFKIAEMDEKYGLIKKGARVADLGCAPGGWTQVAVERVGPTGVVVGMDLTETEAVAGATVLTGDFLAEDAPDRLKAVLGGPADVVMSDMAAPATGHTATDHLRIMGLCEAALDFAMEVLAPDGVFVAKVLKGGTENALLTTMKKAFKTVRHAKPPASRADSAESYVVATGFRGAPEKP
ncbi:MAG: RlmE family RNA methyltransferase [Magnetovibrionaceae bacterium]